MPNNSKSLGATKAALQLGYDPVPIKIVECVEYELALRDARDAERDARIEALEAQLAALEAKVS